MNASHGLLVIDKPGGMTSRDVVDRAQPWFPRRTRLGHTGTLDPLATGVLVLCVGVATRLTEYVQRMAKTYESVFRLGARSDTDDLDGVVEPSPNPNPPPDRARVTEVLRSFLGEIDQVPPAHSAAKVSGRRAYDLARAGEEVTLQARRVRIAGIELLSYDYPRLEVRVHCGKGTYIRSLARDVGERLGCGALVEVLRRTQVGPFTAADALGLDAGEAEARSALRPPSAALSELPGMALRAEEVARLRQGQPLPLAPLAGRMPEEATEGEVAVYDWYASLVGVARIDGPRQLLVPGKMLPRGSQ